ncbi:hypothetical protein [Methylomonas sp. TEB]|uniref:hypothetical protein n=1 Tax=Methylomonas sp. TEB TaxID=3398229 RepID=UPI0039F4F591
MQTLNLDKLQDFTRHDLEDFYQFLLQKYAGQQQDLKESAPLAPRLVKPFEPPPREAVYER